MGNSLEPMSRLSEEENVKQEGIEKWEYKIHLLRRNKEEMAQEKVLANEADLSLERRMLEFEMLIKKKMGVLGKFLDFDDMQVHELANETDLPLERKMLKIEMMEYHLNQEEIRLKQEDFCLKQEDFCLKQVEKRLKQEEKRLKMEENRFKLEENRLKLEENRLKLEENRLKLEEVCLKQEDFCLKQVEKRLKQEENRLKMEEKWLKQEENRLKQEEVCLKQMGKRLQRDENRLKQEEVCLKQEDFCLKQVEKRLKQEENRLKIEEKWLKQEENRLKQEEVCLKQMGKRLQRDENRLKQEEVCLKEEENRVKQKEIAEAQDPFSHGQSQREKLLPKTPHGSRPWMTNLLFGFSILTAAIIFSHGWGFIYAPNEYVGLHGQYLCCPAEIYYCRSGRQEDDSGGCNKCKSSHYMYKHYSLDLVRLMENIHTQNESLSSNFEIFDEETIGQPQFGKSINFFSWRIKCKEIGNRWYFWKPQRFLSDDCQKFEHHVLRVCFLLSVCFLLQCKINSTDEYMYMYDEHAIPEITGKGRLVQTEESFMKEKSSSSTPFTWLHKLGRVNYNIKSLLYKDNISFDVPSIALYPCMRFDYIGDDLLSRLAGSEPPSPQEVMSYEILRLRTFEDFPNEEVFVTPLSKTGFYYYGEGDEVKCFNCHQTKRNWLREEKARSVHRDLCSDCDMVLTFGKNCGNRPIYNFHAENEEEETELESESSAAQEPEEIHAPVLSPVEEEEETAEGERPAQNLLTNTSEKSQVVYYNSSSSTALTFKYPEYADEQERRKSFEKYDPGWAPDVEKFVKGGLFYAGYRDVIKCHCCGLALRNWTPYDDPDVEHARWSPECRFLTVYKGQSFMNSIADAVQKGRSSTFQTDVKAMVNKVMSTSNNIASTQAYYEIKVATYVNQPVTSVNSSPFTPEGLSTQRKTVAMAATETSASAESGQPTRRADVEPNLPELLKDPEYRKAYEENQAHQEKKTCKVCLEAEISVVVLPCGHMVVCENCSLSLKACIICRKLIKGKIYVRDDT